MKTILLLLLVFSTACVQAQPLYVTEKNIPYYADSVRKGDAYLAAQCTLDLYYPKNTPGFATIIWLHGGGLTGGQKEIPRELQEKGYAVIGVGYRLSPKASAPAYIEDAAAAVAWAFRHISSYGGNPGLLFVSGHSAGGYLGMMITLDKHYLARYGIDANRIAGLIPFSGQAITHFTIRKERGIKDVQPVVDAFAPLYHVRPDAPPILLITGDRNQELLGRYEENAYLWRMLQLAGHKRTRLYELQGYDHGGMAGPAFPLLLREVAALRKEVEGR